MTVISASAASVSIAASANPVCNGQSVTFTAMPTNGGTPSYQWQVNGSNTGTNSNTLILSVLSNADVVTAVMISDVACVTGSPASSNGVTMTVDLNPTVANAGPDQNIISSTTFLNASSSVVGIGTWMQVSGGGFIGTPNNPATSVGALPVGANVYHWTVANGSCPSTFDEVTITVGTLAPFVITGPDTIQPSQTYTFSVPFEPGASYIWTVPGGATIVSGNGTNIVTITFGPNVSGTISVTKTSPSGTASATKTIYSITGITGGAWDDSYIVYPNPFMKETYLIITSTLSSKVSINIIDMKGINVSSTEDYHTNEKIVLGNEFPAGVYVVQASYQNKLLTFKIFKAD